MCLLKVAAAGCCWPQPSATWATLLAHDHYQAKDRCNNDVPGGLMQCPGVVGYQNGPDVLSPCCNALHVVSLAVPCKNRSLHSPCHYASRKQQLANVLTFLSVCTHAATWTYGESRLRPRPHVSCRLYLALEHYQAKYQVQQRFVQVMWCSARALWAMNMSQTCGPGAVDNAIPQPPSFHTGSPLTQSPALQM